MARGQLVAIEDACDQFIIGDERKQPQLSRFGETLAELSSTGDRVVCLGHHPGRLERTCINEVAARLGGRLGSCNATVAPSLVPGSSDCHGPWSACCD